MGVRGAKNETFIIVITYIRVGMHLISFGDHQAITIAAPAFDWGQNCFVFASGLVGVTGVAIPAQSDYEGPEVSLK